MEHGSCGRYAEADSYEALVARNKLIAKMVSKAIKRAYPGAKVRQGYVGQGMKAHRRQVWVAIPGGAGVDFWIDRDRLKVGGIIQGSAVPIEFANLSVEEVCVRVVADLAPFAGF